MKRLLWLPGLVLPLLFAPPLLADWDPSMPAKWIQMPDLQPTGIDVNCSPVSQDYILADDFKCTATGPITEIHIWGSWLQDLLPQGDPKGVDFQLTIYSDIPADQNPNEYSTPGEMLWEMFVPAALVTARPYQDGEEGWLDPPDEYLPPPADSICWQYNFIIDENNAFIQTGTPDEPQIYWLGVKAFPHGENGEMFGWKTSLDHWNDDAVWGEGNGPPISPWIDLKYPLGHPWETESIDLAFVINSSVPPPEIDFGDAPDPTYPTRLASNGARHQISNLFLGSLVDGESDGQPDAAATGDDLANLDDEDGVVFTSPLKPNQAATVDVTASTAGMLDAWIDFDDSGSWEASETIFSSLALAPGVNNLSFMVPAVAKENTTTFARFRFSSMGGLAPDGILPTGALPDGEVEDHQVFIEDRFVFKWIQNPDLSPMGIDINAGTGPTGDPYILADDFLCNHGGPVTDIHIWGSWLGDYVPFQEDPGAVVFTLSFHKDIPAIPGTPEYSRPGEILWVHTFAPGEFEVEPVPMPLEEGWMDPPDAYTFPGDWTCWLYKFHVDPHLAFHQEGSEQEGVVYWLDVQARPLDEQARFGWKTTLDHWNDDAVWGIGLEPYPGPWNELVYPPQHEMAGLSIDMAFALFEDLVTGTPETPSGMGLLFNAPNPFNPMTVIHFMMPPDGGAVCLEIYDLQGRLVKVLVDGFVAGGPQTKQWDGRNADGAPQPSGVYLYRLRGAGLDEAMKMLLLR